MVPQKEKFYAYEDYFELIVDKYEFAVIKNKSKNLTPDDKTEILETFNFFYQQVRYIRRLIMRDISTAGIIPTAEIKREHKINSLLTGEGKNED